MTGWVAQETLTEEALTGRVLTGAMTIAVPAEVEGTVNQEDHGCQ